MNITNQTKALPITGKVLIISDLHLSTNFDQVLFNFLQDLIAACDTLIVNGDLWADFKTSLEGFLTSQWKALFPVFKTKKAIYLPGNHDSKKYASSGQFWFFDVIDDYYNFRSGKLLFHVEHGHKFFKYETGLGDYLAHSKLVGKLFSPIYFGFMYLKYYIYLYFNSDIFGWYMNQKIKGGRTARKDISAEAILITGHTHCPEGSLSERFVNGGFFDIGLNSRWLSKRLCTFVTIENGDVKLHKKLIC